jgi:hypothetical protein
LDLAAATPGRSAKLRFGSFDARTPLPKKIFRRNSAKSTLRTAPG